MVAITSFIIIIPRKRKYCDLAFFEYDEILNPIIDQNEDLRFNACLLKHLMEVFIILSEVEG